MGVDHHIVRNQGLAKNGCRASLVVVAVALLLGACSAADRPEGAVERWLIALNQGPTGEPGRYASEELSEQILPKPRGDGDLSVIEVGKGVVDQDTARVPYRIEGNGTTIRGTAELDRSSGQWQVVALAPRDPALEVPSAGGERIGKAPANAWLIALATAALLTLVTVGLMRLAGEKPSAA